jgi:hypothetical protein
MQGHLFSLNFNNALHGEGLRPVFQGALDLGIYYIFQTIQR